MPIDGKYKIIAAEELPKWDEFRDAWTCPDDYLDTDLNLHKYLVKSPSSTFFIVAKGHSMEGAGISDEDLLVVSET